MVTATSDLPPNQPESHMEGGREEETEGWGETYYIPQSLLVLSNVQESPHSAKYQMQK